MRWRVLALGAAASAGRAAFVVPLVPLVSLALTMCLCGPTSAGELLLGPEQIIQAGGADLVVAGYSVPCIVDWDGDGKADLIVGEGGAGYPGKVRIYRNVAASSDALPQYAGFQYAQSQGADLAVTSGGCLGAFPRPADWNGDGRKDLLLGLYDGRVKVYLNVATDAAPAFDGGTYLTAGPAGAKTTLDVGDRSTLDVADWDNDGRRDLILGAYDGRIRVCLNVGSAAAPDLAAPFAVPAGAGDLLVPSGRSSPVIMDLDGDGRKDLLTGDTDGELLLYGNSGTDGSPAFSTWTAVAADGTPIDLADTPRSRPFIADWNADGLLDVLIGAGDGKVHLYLGVPEPASAAILALGAAGTLLRRRRRGV